MKKNKIMKNSTIKLFYDLETSGLDFRKNCILQLSGILEIDGTKEEEFDYFIQPHPKAIIEPKALESNGLVLEDLDLHQSIKEVYQDFTSRLKRHIDPFNKKQKAFLIGYNNSRFDDNFLRMFFRLNEDEYFGSLFWQNTIDVMVLASQYLIQRRKDMPNFRLATVAKTLKLDIKHEEFHNALYDVKVTRLIYDIITSYG